MIEGADRLPPRLFTVHGTVLYVDSASGELRHGPHLSSPVNVRLVRDGSRGEIVLEENGLRRPVACAADRCWIAGEGGLDPPAAFEVMQLDCNWVGLRSTERFLSAIPDGGVALSATQCQAWENFLLADPPPRAAGANATARRQPSLSISCVETRDPRKAVRAVDQTAACIAVDCVYWFSTQPFPGKLPGIEVVNILVSEFEEFFDDTNKIFLRLMPRVVQTEFNLIVQADGFAVNPQAWDARFWEYDYIGAPWPWMWGGGPYWRGPIVGNGGFSLRSRKLYRALLDLDLKLRPEEWADDERFARREFHVFDRHGQKHISEDILISLWYRDQLEQRFGIRFCPPELANKFCVETVGPFTQFWLGRSFGFHGVAAAPYY